MGWAIFGLVYYGLMFHTTPEMAFGDGKELDRLETAMEAAGLAWWWMELPSGGIFFSPNKARMLGREKENFFHYNDFVKLVHEDDQERIMQDMTNLMEGKASVYETTYRILASDGSYRQFYDKGRIVARNASELEIAGIVFDITDIDITKIAKFSAQKIHKSSITTKKK